MSKLSRAIEPVAKAGQAIAIACGDLGRHDLCDGMATTWPDGEPELISTGKAVKCECFCHQAAKGD